MGINDRPAAESPIALSERGRVLYAAYCARLAAQAGLPDDTIFMEVSGAHYVTVTREEGNLLLWLLARRGDGSGVVQSEIDPAHPLALVDPYLQAAMLALLWGENPQRIFTAGLGGGCLPTLLHCYFPDAHIHCVELDSTVAEAARRYFGFQTDETLQLTIGDGRSWLEAHSPHEKFDLILIDAFLDNGYAPIGMATREFCELCLQRLSATGVLVVNLLYLGTHNRERVQTVKSVFEHVYLCSLGEENDLLFASPAPLPAHAQIIARAEELKRRHRFAFPFVRHALRLLAVDALPEMESGAILRDAAPPADYFALLPVVDAEIEIGPDAPCLCGSGRSYSVCHGAG